MTARAIAVRAGVPLIVAIWLLPLNVSEGRADQPVKPVDAALLGPALAAPAVGTMRALDRRVELLIEARSQLLARRAAARAARLPRNADEEAG